MEEVRIGRVVKGVVVGIAVDDADVDKGGEVRPPQVQTPFVPRGI